MLDMKRLRLLWELSVRGTVVAVAEALSYSPSAVSQQLALLEREAGVPLLRKTGRTLELTPAAEALVAETEELLAGLERAEAALHSAHAEVSGTVRIAVFQTALLAMLPQTLRRLRETHPHLRVEMVQHEPAAAEFARVETLADAASLPWVMEPEGAASRHWALQACRSEGFDPDIRYETADLQAHLRLIESGNAVALLPGLVHYMGEPRIRLLPLEGDPHRTIFTAARAAAGAHPALSAVRTALSALAGSALHV